MKRALILPASYDGGSMMPTEDDLRVIQVDGWWVVQRYMLKRVSGFLWWSKFAYRWVSMGSYCYFEGRRAWTFTKQDVPTLFKTREEAEAALREWEQSYSYSLTCDKLK